MTHTHSEKPNALLNLNFVLLWQGQLVSHLGRQGFLIAMMFWTMEATGSASLMGLLMMLTSLPGLILGPLGGTFADRYSRRKIIMGSDCLRGLNVLVLTGFMFFHGESPALIIPLLCVVAVVDGVISAFFTPAVSAAIPDLVPREKVALANSLNQISIRGSVSLGQAVGGVLYRLLGAPVLFLIDALSYLVSAASEAFIEIPQRLPDKRERAGSTWSIYTRQTMEGLAYVWRRPGMRYLLVTMSVMNFFLMPMFVLLPFYVTDFLGAGSDVYGYVMAVFGIGSLAGYGVAGALRLSPRGRRRVVVSSLFAVSGLLALTAVGPMLPLAMACFFGIGLFAGLIDILLVTLLQTSTPGEMRGRVMGLAMALSRAVSPIGMGLGGLLGDLTGKNVPALYLACGSACLLVTILTLKNRHFLSFLAWEK